MLDFGQSIWLETTSLTASFKVQQMAPVAAQSECNAALQCALVVGYIYYRCIA